MPLTYVTITGTFDDGSGTALTGTVTFTPSQAVYASGIPLVTPAAPVPAKITAGSLVNASGGPLTLLATDNAGLATESSTGFWYWTVSFGIAGMQPFSFFLPSSPSTVDLLKLANTGATGGGGGITLPAGDLGGSNTVPTVVGTHLAPVTFTFGTTGAVPASGTFTAGNFAVDQNGIVRVCTASGTPGTWARAAQQSHEFYVDDYGAKGDGKIGTGGTGTSGTTGFTDTGASFVSGDTGKLIIVNQGAKGSNTLPFTGTITFSSSTSVTLNANLGANAASAPYIYGTDDVAAINRCITAAAAWAQANAQKARVVFSDKFYVLGAVTQQTSPVRYNTHLPLPYSANTAAKLVIELAGAGFSPAYQFWDTVAMPLNGTCLVSAITPSVFQPDATFGQFSVLGTPNNGVPSSLNPFANALYIVNGLTIVTPWGSAGGGMDGIYMSQMELVSAKAAAFAPVNFGAATQGGPNLTSSTYPTNDTAVGFRFPTWGNNAFSHAGYAVVEGFSIGFDVGEHFSAQYLMCDYVDRCFQINNPSQTPLNHGITVQHASFESANHIIYVLNGTGGNFCPIFFGLLDVESVGTDQVSDSASVLTGHININSFTGTHLTIAGGQNVIITDVGKYYPGPWSGAPAAPASGTGSTNTQQNTSYHYATVYASASTSITNVFVGQAATGLTSTAQAGGANVVVPIRVGPGSYYSVTYTGTLTTRWFLD